MLPFKILKEPKLIMFQVKIIHNILPTQSSLFRSRITDTDVCPLCNLESQSLKHMLITCSVSSSFWTCFSNWWHENFIKNWLYRKALFYMVGTKSQITGKCLITVWLSPNIMFLLQVYATASWTLTVICCVSTTKLIFFVPLLLNLTAYRNSKKHGTNFFRYVNASVISIILIPSSYTLLLYCFTYEFCVVFLLI